MEEIRPGSRDMGALRARVTARRARAQRWEHVRETLTPGRPQPGVLKLARRRRRWRGLPPISLNFELPQIPIPRKLVEFVVALGLVALIGLVILPRALPGNRRGEPSAVQAEAIATPQPVPMTSSGSDEPVSIMLLGSDQRPQDPSFRTDVMMLVNVSPKQGQIKVLSFPRDLVGKIPGYGDSRINVVMSQGGFETLRDTFDQSYGARPQYYFMINFDAFVGLINSMGGITVQAEQYLSDSCDLPQSRAGICTVEPGPQDMDGAMALWYVRSRHSSSDFDRLRRAQEVLAAIFSRFMKAGASMRLAEFYLDYGDSVETNMDLPQMVRLLPVAAQVFADQSRIQRYAITHDITADWIMPDGAAVQLPDYEAVKRVVQEASFEE
jgi:LCP family protein required for cell wall assembly